MKCRLCGALTAFASHASDEEAARLSRAIDKNPLPAELAPMAGHMAAQDVFLLLERYGGTRIYIPTEPNHATKLSMEFGAEAARGLSAWRGGETVDIPLCRWWRLRIWRDAGCSYNEAARHFGLSQNGVWRLLSAQGMTDAASSPRSRRGSELCRAAP